jgi:hypothetical protein
MGLFLVLSLFACSSVPVSPTTVLPDGLPPVVQPPKTDCPAGAICEPPVFVPADSTFHSGFLVVKCADNGPSNSADRFCRGVALKGPQFVAACLGVDTFEKCALGQLNSESKISVSNPGYWEVEPYTNTIDIVNTAWVFVRDPNGILGPEWDAFPRVAP